MPNEPTTPIAQWRTRPVFLTSTFRDMHEERDWLAHHIVPELEERLRQRHCHLETIDLRWGVKTTDVNELESKELLVLKVCLNEIERSRPFLIALLGDRYGWVPPAERMAAAAQEAGFQTTVAGKSITALEIEFGALDSADQRRRSHFYFRDPLPYGQMDPETAAQYSELHSGDPQAQERHDALQALKARIERQLPGRAHRYTAAWDARQKKVTGLEAFGRMVLDDLWRDLEAEIPPLDQQATVTWQDQERAALAEFVERGSRDFVGRDNLVRNLMAFVLGDVAASVPDATSGKAAGTAATTPVWAVSLTGPAGAGKSALSCKLHRLLERENVLLLAHAAGISVRSTSVDSLIFRWIGELATALRVPVPIAENAKADEMEAAFARLLAQAAQQRRVVVLLDALNQFEPGVRAQYLTWLPKVFPANARLLTTAIPGTASRALEERPGVHAQPLPPLNRSEAELIAEKVCARYHRQLPGDVLNELVSKRQPDGAPASGNPLWLELALEELNLLDADDFQRAERDYHGTGEQKLHQLLVDTARQLPADIESLYGWMLQRTEEVWGVAWARAFADLTALSRAGWRESDLEQLLPKAAELSGMGFQPMSTDNSGQAPTGKMPVPLVGPNSQPPDSGLSPRHSMSEQVTPDSGVFTWDPLRFAGLRRSFRAQLLQRGALGQWDFHHTQTRLAVHRRNLADVTHRQRLHSLIADHLLALPATDPLRESETMVHLIGADDQARAARVYADLPIPFGSPSGATQALARHIVLGTEERRRPGGRSLDGHRRDGGVPDQRLQLHPSAEQQPNPNLHWTTALLDQPGLTGQQVDYLASRFTFDLRDALENITALPTRRTLLEAARHSLERLARQDPGNAAWQRDLTATYQRIGDIFTAQGDLRGALKSYEDLLAVAKKLAASDTSNADWQRNLSVSYNKLGDVQSAQGDLAGALASYRQSHEIFERLARQDPGNAAWQRDLSVSYIKLGDVQRAQGDLAGALASYRQALGIRERLARQDPGNAAWQRDLAAAHCYVGMVLEQQGDLAGALEAYRKYQTAMERLARQDPGNAEWQRDLVVSYWRMADMAEQNNTGDAAQWYRKAYEQLAGMKQRGIMLPTDEPYLEQLRRKIED